jgi:quercetin dioxygenase-like cupin family protein
VQENETNGLRPFWFWLGSENGFVPVRGREKRNWREKPYDPFREFSPLTDTLLRGLRMNATYTYLADLQHQIPKIPADSIISRTLHDDEQIKVVLFAFATRQELSEHTASMPAMLYFVKGEADLTLGDEALTAQAGTWVHMPPHLPHSIVAKTQVVMLLLLLKMSS